MKNRKSALYKFLYSYVLRSCIEDLHSVVDRCAKYLPEEDKITVVKSKELVTNVIEKVIKGVNQNV